MIPAEPMMPALIDDARTSVNGAAAPLWARVVGVVRSPSSTFQDVIRRPVWLDMLAALTLVSALSTAAFLATVGRSPSTLAASA